VTSTSTSTSTPPEYLFAPDAALAERSAWEVRVEHEVHEALLAHVPGPVLTAAALPGWNLAVRAIQTALGLPATLLGRMLDRQAPEADAATTAARLAPTLATQAYNLHVLGLLVEHRIPYKRWLSRRDEQVRPTHLHVDGRSVPLSSPFLVGTGLMQYPADSRTAPVGEWLNDRCVLLASLERSPVVT
jgi:hypothetical protein